MRSQEPSVWAVRLLGEIDRVCLSCCGKKAAGPELKVTATLRVYSLGLSSARLGEAKQASSNNNNNRNMEKMASELALRDREKPKEADKSAGRMSGALQLEALISIPLLSLQSSLAGWLAG